MLKCLKTLRNNHKRKKQIRKQMQMQQKNTDWSKIS